MVQIFPSAVAMGASSVQVDPTRHKYVGHLDEISSARGIPPKTYASSSESCTDSERVELPESDRSTGQDTRIMLLDEEGPDPPEPTVRIPTKPKRVAGDRAYPQRSTYLD